MGSCGVDGGRLAVSAVVGPRLAVGRAGRWVGVTCVAVPRAVGHRAWRVAAGAFHGGGTTRAAVRVREGAPPGDEGEEVAQEAAAAAARAAAALGKGRALVRAGAGSKAQAQAQGPGGSSRELRALARAQMAMLAAQVGGRAEVAVYLREGDSDDPAAEMRFTRVCCSSEFQFEAPGAGAPGVRSSPGAAASQAAVAAASGASSAGSSSPPVEGVLDGLPATAVLDRELEGLAGPLELPGGALALPLVLQAGELASLGPRQYLAGLLVAYAGGRGASSAAVEAGGGAPAGEVEEAAEEEGFAEGDMRALVLVADSLASACALERGREVAQRSRDETLALLAGVSRELKGPLAASRTMSRMLLRGLRAEEAGTRDLLGNILDQAERSAQVLRAIDGYAEAAAAAAGGGAPRRALDAPRDHPLLRAPDEHEVDVDLF